jgi:plastocyanin
MISLHKGRMRPNTVGPRVLAAAALMLLLGQTIVASADETNMTVGIDNFAFVPAELTIKPGVTVTWENHDSTVHTVVGPAGSFRSTALDTGDKFSFTFEKPGEFAYFCTLHPHMKGKIIVAPR